MNETTFQALIDAGLIEIGDGYRAKNNELGGTGPLFLRAGHVSDTHISFDGVERFHAHLADVVASKMSKPRDVVITTKGNSTGRTTYVTEDLPPFVYSPHLSYWRSKDHDAVVPGFLRAWSNGAEFTEQLDGMKLSTDMAPYLSLTDQRRLHITLPPPAEQRAIARVLGGLDDKIELNRRMNRTLEDLARGVFRSWFVDFDPVTKSPKGLAGHASGPPTVAPAGAAAAGSIGSAAGVTGSAAGMIRSAAGVIASASPGGGAPLAPTPPPPARTPPPQVQTPWPTRLVDSPLGPIPEGWRVGTVADLCTTQYGYTASATDDAVGPRMLRVTDMNKEPWVEWADVPHCRIDDDLLPRYALKLGDVLVSRMADPGKAAIVEEVLPEGAVFASYLIRLATRSIAASYYLFYYLRSDQYLDYAESVSGGTVQKNMNAQVITAAQMVIAPDAIADEFARIVRPWRAQIAANLQQSRHLAALRDALLPQLLSGEIRLREAERAVDDALQSTRTPPRAGGPTLPRGGKAAGTMKGRA